MADDDQQRKLEAHFDELVAGSKALEEQRQTELTALKAKIEKAKEELKKAKAGENFYVHSGIDLALKALE